MLAASFAELTPALAQQAEGTDTAVRLTVFQPAPAEATPERLRDTGLPDGFEIASPAVQSGGRTSPPCNAAALPASYLRISISSTSNTSDAPGGITLPAPSAP